LTRCTCRRPSDSSICCHCRSQTSKVPQTVAIGDKDHGRIAMAVAAMLAGTVHQSLDLALGEIAPFNCQVYDGWCAFLGCRFHADKPCLRATYCLAYTSFLHSLRRGGWECTVIDRGRLPGAAVRRRRQPQGGGWVDPRGGGSARIENSSRRHPRKFDLKRFLVPRKRCWRGSRVACFWATSLEKISAARSRSSRSA